MFFAGKTCCYTFGFRRAKIRLFCLLCYTYNILFQSFNFPLQVECLSAAALPQPFRKPVGTKRQGDNELARLSGTATSLRESWWDLQVGSSKPPKKHCCERSRLSHPDMFFSARRHLPSRSLRNFSRKISPKVPHLETKSPTVAKIFLEKFFKRPHSRKNRVGELGRWEFGSLGVWTIALLCTCPYGEPWCTNYCPNSHLPNSQTPQLPTSQTPKLPNSQTPKLPPPQLPNSPPPHLPKKLSQYFWIYPLFDYLCPHNEDKLRDKIRRTSEGCTAV